MIILDLTNYKGGRPSIWPEDMPLMIRLIKGTHQKGYDIHPMIRTTKWYKKLLENSKKEYPDKRWDGPIGLSSHEVPIKQGAIIRRMR